MSGDRQILPNLVLSIQLITTNSNWETSSRISKWLSRKLIMHLKISDNPKSLLQTQNVTPKCRIDSQSNTNRFTFSLNLSNSNQHKIQPLQLTVSLPKENKLFHPSQPWSSLLKVAPRNRIIEATLRVDFTMIFTRNRSAMQNWYPLSGTKKIKNSNTNLQSPPSQRSLLWNPIATSWTNRMTSFTKRRQCTRSTQVLNWIRRSWTSKASLRFQTTI